MTDGEAIFGNMAHPFRKFFFALLPKAAMSRATGRLMACELKGVSSMCKALFVRFCKPDLSEAELPPDAYPTAQALFTRRLRPGARPVADAPLVSPVDARLRTAGTVEAPDLEMTQVKGVEYTLAQLVGDERLAESFSGGRWGVFYLAPFNYHRIHAPCDAELEEVVHLPGNFWPVNDWSVEAVPGLFAVNERVVAVLKHPSGARALMVMVAATNVGQIRLAADPEFASNGAPRRAARRWKPEGKTSFARGEEFGTFMFGSTVVLVLDRAWEGLLPEPPFSALGQAVRMGQKI